MLKIAIVDDSTGDSEKLKGYLKAYFNEKITNYDILTYASGEDFLLKNAVKNFDIIFLDIYMKGLTGVDVAKNIRLTNEKCAIIFVSSSNDFAMESYEVGALQYLLKPYTYENFEKSLSKVISKVKITDSCFMLNTKTESIKILISDIKFIDYSNHYVQVHTENEIIKSYAVTFAEVMETILKYSNFLPCYRNITINMDKAAKIDGKYFVMLSGENIPINRDKAKEIKQKYHQYLFTKLEGAV